MEYLFNKLWIFASVKQTTRSEIWMTKGITVKWTAIYNRPFSYKVSLIIILACGNKFQRVYLVWTFRHTLNVHYSTCCWKLDLESSNVVTAAAFNTLLRREAKFSADCFVNGVSATCCFRAIDQRSDVIKLIANKEIFCGVQISINEAKNALFLISFHWCLEK